MVESHVSPPGAAPTASDGVTTREKIVTAALAAFADHGVRATSLDAIAAAVGVRKQTLLYWFPSKEHLLFAVIDHAVGDLGTRLGAAARRSQTRWPGRLHRAGHRELVAVVDATFRLGASEPALLAVVREIARLGPPASTRLAAAAEPLVVVAVGALTGRGPGHEDERARLRAVLLAAGARVVGMVTEAELREDLGLPADVAWLRSRRRDLLAFLATGLSDPIDQGVTRRRTTKGSSP